MRLVTLTIAIAPLLVSCTRTDAPVNPDIASQLVGSWNLVEYDRRDDSGKVAEMPYGDDPQRILVYTVSGGMSVHMVDRRVGEFESGDFMMGSPAEIKEAYEGYFGYFGTCPSSNKWNRGSDYLVECFVPRFDIMRRVAGSANGVSGWFFS